MTDRTPFVNKKYEEFRLATLHDIIYKYSSRKNNITVADLGYANWPNKNLINDKNMVVTGIDCAPNKSEFKYDDELVMDLTTDLSNCKKYDVLLAGELIEHMENPYQFLRNIKNLAHDDSILILSTPNILSIPSILFEYLNSEKYFYSRNHTYFFSPRWMKRVLDLSGWNLLSKQGLGSNLVYFRLVTPCVLSTQIIYISSPSVA